MKRRFTVALAALALVPAACGQYAGVHERAVASGQIAAGVGGSTAGLSGTGVAGSGVSGTGATRSGTVAGGTGGSSGGTGAAGTTSSGAGTTPAGGGDRTGVTANTITIGIHAPLTGAAPLAQTSFVEGKDLYWENGNNGKPVEIYGRQVQVVFQDDQYNPSHARLVCQQMAEQEHAFLLVGGGGTDQIQACAQYAASQGIPYLSAGVTEVGLDQLGNYFALSKSYPQQAPMLASYIKKAFHPRASRVAMVATNTANFDDAVQSFQRAFPGVAVFRPEKNERGSTMAGRLCTGTVKNYDVVFPLVAPTYYLEMAGAAKCNPQYVGVGITMGLDSVARLGCESRSTEGARFFSPAPAFADSNRYDAEFRRAGGSDDIMWLLWGLSRALHQLFQEAGPNLHREGFISRTSTASIRTGVYPDIRYSPGNHFGAQQVHLLRNVCRGGGRYVTERAFVSRF
jgi:branched-chain amino acid transport system substrate-binding protein